MQFKTTVNKTTVMRYPTRLSLRISFKMTADIYRVIYGDKTENKVFAIITG